MKKNELKYCMNGVYLLRNCNQLFEFIGKINEFFKISQKNAQTLKTKVRWHLCEHQKMNLKFQQDRK